MAANKFKYDVFISYNHADEKWVCNTLLPALEKAGLKVCIDFRDFEAGKPALFNMQDASKESRRVLLVLTRNWLNGEWTHFEAIIAGTKDPAGFQRKIIPLLCEAGIEKDIPDFISMRTWIDFTRADREATSWKRLLTDIGKPDATTPDTPHLTPFDGLRATPDTWNLKHPYGLPKDFTGRVDERKMLTAWLEDDHEQPLMVIRALGGFGKSALAWYWLTHEVDKSRWTRVLWWSFYEGDASFDGFIREAYELLVGRENVPANPRVLAGQVVEALKQPARPIMHRRASSTPTTSSCSISPGCTTNLRRR
jgi:hypothetical protein